MGAEAAAVRIAIEARRNDFLRKGSRQEQRMVAEHAQQLIAQRNRQIRLDVQLLVALDRGRQAAGGDAAIDPVGGFKALDGLKGANSDQDVGVGIIRRALEAPLRQIAENSGVDGAVVAGKIRESTSLSFGFNAQTEEYGDMFAFGVIDPAKVTRTALENAASVASLLITTEAMIADKPADKSAPAMPGGGGMGGMDF